MKSLKCLLAGLALLLAVPGLCLGANALIVHDGTGSPESDALGNLNTHLVGKGYTVTQNVGVPGGSLAGYQQIWDIRYNNTTPLTGSDNTAYLTFLQGGGRLLLIGENTAFFTRNNSIVAFVALAGGGTLQTVTTANNFETVQPPFTGPTALSNVTYQAAAGVNNPPGAPITMDVNKIAAAIVFSPTLLSAAPTGTLIIVFDVNFLQVGAPDPNVQTLTDNLISYLNAPTFVAPPLIPAPLSIPTLSEWTLAALALLVALFGAGALRRRFRMPV
jgi:hypothetical protein